MIVDNGATLDMNGFDNEVNTLSGNGTVENSASGTSVWLGVGVDDTPNETDHDTIFGGVLQDVGTGQIGLAKLGDDMLTLSGSNTFSGPTIVEGGTLYIASTGSIANSPVTLAGGQVIDGPSATSVATTVTLTSSTGDPTNPSVYGDSVTFTATVSPTNSGYGTPTGTVDFYDESTETDLGQGTLSDGVFTLQTSSLDAEDHYITATFTPDTNSIFITSASDPLDQEVGPETTSTAVTVFDSTQNQSTNSPTYSDQLTFTATVSPTVSGMAIPAIDGEGNAETVDFQDQTTGQDLGTVALTANSDGTASAVFQTSDLALGSHTIIAVYSGDDNFASSASTDTNGSSAAVTVVGEALSFASLYRPGGGPTGSQGGIDILYGRISGLDGAAFRVTVVWGDGQTSDSDNGGQPFYCAAGTTTFLVTHYYAVPGDFTLDVTATAADGRQVEDNSSVSLNVTPAAPSVILDPPPVPEGGFAQHPDSEYTVSAEAFSPDPASLTYEWTLEGTTVLSTGSSSVTVTGAEYDDVWLTVGSSGGATTVTLCDPTQTIGVVEGLPAAPTLTITESDANQMVFEGDVATFDVHATWAAWTMSPLGTASQGWWVSSALPNVDYSTMDASGAAPADYVSTRGPRPVAFGNVTYDSATGMYSADGTITVRHGRRDRRRRGRGRDGATDAPVYVSDCRRRGRPGHGDDRASGRDDQLAERDRGHNRRDRGRWRSRGSGRQRAGRFVVRGRGRVGLAGCVAAGVLV